MSEGKMRRRDLIAENGYEGVVVFDNPSYDEALLGVSSDDRAVYDYDKMVQCLVDNENMSPEEAMEFIDYNTLRAMDYYNDGPIVLFSF